jgi:energy-converting hydrogenase Eha subunit H
MSVMMFIFGVIGMTTFGLVIVATIVQAVTLFMMTSTRVEIRTRKQKEADKKRAKVHTPDGITDIGDHWNCWLCDHPEEP